MLEMAKSLQQIHNKGVVHCDLKPQDVLVVPAETMQVNIVDYGHARFLGQDLQLGPEPSSVRLASPTTDIYDLGKIMSSIFHEIGEEWPTKLLEVKQTIFSSDPKVRPNLEKIIKDVENCLEETIETLTPVTNPVEDIKDVENCLEETIETLTPVTNPVEDIKDVENCLEETIETLTPVTNPVEDIKDVENCLEETIETLTPVTNPVEDIKDVEKCLEETIETLTPVTNPVEEESSPQKPLHNMAK
ncbi:Serine/threonine-protein kinase PknA-like [Homarus americanus]|uniref:Serine/threonine-protein kinase PknA-like n=1 Tax=Homarus americanus TaxID=6706 RepID=A0A8J5JS76_HOMAM|nr:Serine/threonine-protein kinase PknA-like [Homarus americanus]